MCVYINIIYIWQCVKTLYPCSSHQNSWDLWMVIPLKMVLIGIDPWPYVPRALGNHVVWKFHEIPVEKKVMISKMKSEPLQRSPNCKK